MRKPARKLDKRFTFAGFSFPRYIAQLSKDGGRWCFTPCYYHMPDPHRSDRGQGFYLEDMSRVRWADKVSGARIYHTGWFTDEYMNGDKIRGVVVLLPHGRFLAGWSMGEGMVSSVSADRVYTDEVEAAYAADSEAECAAEQEREYQEEQRRLEAEEEYNQGGDAEELEGY